VSPADCCIIGAGVFGNTLILLYLLFFFGLIGNVFGCTDRLGGPGSLRTRSARDGSSCWRSYSSLLWAAHLAQLCGRHSIVFVTPALDLAAAVTCEAQSRL
jgi:hypothetical protein